MKTCLPHSQRGAATLIVVLALLGAMLITLLAANRNLLLELRQSANQVEAAAAFEAAEAGIDWGLSMLNADARLGGDCRASPLATQSLRERMLDLSGPTLTTRGVRPACVREAAGWRCGCPDAGPAALGAAAEGPSFALQLQPAAPDGTLRLVAVGCAHFGGDCHPDGAGRDGAVAQHQALIALMPALAVPPTSALTLRPGGTTPESFFAATFGLSKGAWTGQPAARRIDCVGECSAAVALAVDQGATLIVLPGDATLRGPLVLGTAQRPVLIVAAGALQLQGAVQLTGAAYAASLGWAAPGATVRGALISEGGAAGDTSLDLQRDAAVLEFLRTRQGSFVRLPGGWRDF